MTISEPYLLAQLTRRYFPGAMVTRNHSWAHRQSVVIQLRTPDSTSIVAKAHGQRAKFDQEVAAYELLVPALGDHAPRLLEVDPVEQVIFMSWVPGRRADELTQEPALHRRAGELLASFHSSVGVGTCIDHGAHLVERLDAWVARAAPGLLAADEVTSIHHLVDELRGWPDPPAVPLHRDWQPRNWLVDGDDVYVFDFEHSRPGPWVEDLSRLWWAEWADRPDLKEAMLAGYGRHVDDTDRAWLMGISAVAAVSTVVWADEHGDAAFGRHGRRILALLAGDGGSRPGS